MKELERRIAKLEAAAAHRTQDLTTEMLRRMSNRQLAELMLECLAQEYPTDPRTAQARALYAAGDYRKMSGLFSELRGVDGLLLDDDDSPPECLLRPIPSPAPEAQPRELLDDQIAALKDRIAAGEDRIIEAFAQLPHSDQLPVAVEVRMLLAAGDRSRAAAVIVRTLGQRRDN